MALLGFFINELAGNLVRTIYAIEVERVLLLRIHLVRGDIFRLGKTEMVKSMNKSTPCTSAKVFNKVQYQISVFHHFTFHLGET